MEEDLLRALEAISQGDSIRKASLEWGIPRSTLQSRIYGHQTRQTGAEALQKLAPVQEKRLTDWILVQESLGLSPTHSQIKDFAQRLLTVRGDTTTLGKRWIRSFLKRNPILRTKRQYSIDSVRVNGATSEIIKLWFQKFQIPEIKAIKPENRWNMDEAGIMEGQGVNGLVVGSKNRRFIQRKQPGSRAWTSFIECISATGRALDPLVIYKGKSVQQQWFPTNLDKFSRWHFTATENGWTTDVTAQEWLDKVFIPSTALPDPQEPRLLVLDGHGSHETTEFMYTCFMHNIYLLFLPPHSSHVLQPLDLSIFSPLKAAYRKELGNLSLLSDSTPIGKRNFLLCYQKAREQSLIPKNIKAGWKATGLWPINMAKPLMSRLLLENSNNDSAPAPKDLIREEGLVWNENISAIQWETPRKARDVRLQADIITRLGETDLPTRRQLFKKLAKGWDEKDYALAQAELRIKQLEAKIEGSQPKKRRKVRVSPNSKFASVRAIKVAQIEAGDREIEEGDSDSSVNTEATGDCIEVQGL
jgi:4-hydroxybenzoate polyprenyltransferase